MRLDELGRGVFIWQLSQCDSPEVMVKKLQEHKIEYVIVKIADGFSALNTKAYDKYFDAFQRGGIVCSGWAYVYGKPGEAAFHAQRVQDTLVSSFVVNAEKEFKVSGPLKAESYMECLRNAIGGDFPVGLSSYGWPSNHGKFPFKEFLKSCDWAMPQCYWFTKEPIDAASVSLVEYSIYQKPVILTGAAWLKGIGSYERFEVFIDYVESFNNYNLWSYQHMDDRMWKIIAGYQVQEAQLLRVSNAAGVK